MPTADQIASVIVSRRSDFTDAMKLQKLLYYVQAWHLAVTDSPLFQESFQAWRDGPVIPQVWHARRDRKTRTVEGQGSSSVSLTELESDIIDLVLETYGQLSGHDLSVLTHEELPWIEARGDTPEGDQSSAPLSVKTMASYYRDLSKSLGGQTATDIAVGGVSRGLIEASELNGVKNIRPTSGSSIMPSKRWSMGGFEAPKGGWRKRRQTCLSQV